VIPADKPRLFLLSTQIVAQKAVKSTIRKKSVLIIVDVAKMNKVKMPILVVRQNTIAKLLTNLSESIRLMLYLAIQEVNHFAWIYLHC
jgi:hypothetical protein